jgi:ribonuclease HI
MTTISSSAHTTIRPASTTPHVGPADRDEVGGRPGASTLPEGLGRTRLVAAVESLTSRALVFWDTLRLPFTRPLSHDSATHVQSVLSSGAHAVIRAKNTPVGPIAVLAITGHDGQVFTRRFKVGATGSAQSARLNALEFLTYRIGNTWYSLYIDDTELRNNLNAHRRSFPTFELTPTPHAGSDREANHALNGTNKPAHIATTQGLDHIIIATDASVAVNGTPGAGLGWAASDGTTGTRYMPGTGDIGWAELNAIHDALRASTNHHSVVILSDNQHAVALAAGHKEGKHPRDRDLAATIASLIAGRDVTIQWVRAHTGHPLNETADTLATTARRTHQRTTTTAALKAPTPIAAAAA